MRSRNGSKKTCGVIVALLAKQWKSTARDVTNEQIFLTVKAASVDITRLELGGRDDLSQLPTDQQIAQLTGIKHDPVTYQDMAAIDNSDAAIGGALKQLFHQAIESGMTGVEAYQLKQYKHSILLVVTGSGEYTVMCSRSHYVLNGRIAHGFLVATGEFSPTNTDADAIILAKFLRRYVFEQPQNLRRHANRERFPMQHMLISKLVNPEETNAPAGTDTVSESAEP